MGTPQGYSRVQPPKAVAQNVQRKPVQSVAPPVVNTAALAPEIAYDNLHQNAVVVNQGQVVHGDGEVKAPKLVKVKKTIKVKKKVPKAKKTPVPEPEVQAVEVQDSPTNRI